jgi:hypothetical protein
MSYTDPIDEEKTLSLFARLHKTIIIGIGAGLFLVILSFFLEDEVLKYYQNSEERAGRLVVELLREFGVVLISVWGVSLFYERFIANRHFRTFQTKLEGLMGRGESNAAVCEGTGIKNIYRDRGSFERNHPLVSLISGLRKGDHLRIVGRSLVFLMYNWQQLRPLVENGGALQLCLINPKYDNDLFRLLAGYSNTETALALERFNGSFLPWLESSRPNGTVEIRFHNLPLLDSYTERKRDDEYRSVWDLNFGEGLQSRVIFYLDAKGVFGENLRQHRYGPIWDRSERVFKYCGGQITLNELGKYHALERSETLSQALHSDD